MKNLLYKELTFSIHKFFFIFPFLLSLLFFIPNWIFSIVFMYFFWVSMTQLVVAYTTQGDYQLLSMLPVTKKDIVVSKISAIMTVELIHIILGAIFGIIHIWIYGTYNFFIAINPAFFGMIFATFGIFNIIFFPLYFKTAYKFGKPVIYAVVATTLFVFFFEYGHFGIAFVRDMMSHSNALVQYGILLIGIGIFTLLSLLSMKYSTRNYVNIT